MTHSTTSLTVSSVTDGIYQDEFLFGEPYVAKLYGRQDELEVLTNAYNLVQQQKSYQKVVVSGQSGSGKTFLVSAFQKKVLQKNGFFCSGKHFQNSRLGQDLYPALISAFSDLCDIVLQSEDFDEKRRSEIKEILGKDGDLLAKAGANIAPFLDDEPCFSSSYMKCESSFAKFKVVCKNFLRAMSSREHPVVLFIDDIQWMDNGTRQLLEVILEATEIKHFMLILAHRDTEEASLATKDLLKNISHFNHVKLGELDFNPLKEMILDELSVSSLDDNDYLCKLIWRKTQGNPFHAKQFMNSIKNDGFLSLVDGKWVCDVEVIQEEMMISDCLADLLSTKVQRLEIHLQEILKIASLLGFFFVKETLHEISNEYFKSNQPSDKQFDSDHYSSSEMSDSRLTSYLDKAVEEGFLEKIRGGYQFSHDKLQSIFQESMQNDVREKLHLLIGRSLLSNQAGDSFIYQAATHLNIVSKHHLKTKEEHVQLAKTNLRASQYCEIRSAYLESLSFLEQALALLGNESKWSENFDLSLAITESLARMNLIVGNLEECKSINKEIALRAKTSETICKYFLLEVDIHLAADDFAGLIAVGRKAVNKLGLTRWPKNAAVTPLSFFFKLVKLRKRFDKTTDKEILDLPHSEDSNLSTTIFILNRITCLGVLKQQYLLGAYCTLFAMELTITKGLCPTSAEVFTNFGGFELHYYRGEGFRWLRLGGLAIKLLEKFSFKDADCHILPNLALNTMYRKRTVADLFDLYPNALQDGYEKGDIVSLAMCASALFNTHFWLGENLFYLEEKIRATYVQMKDLGHSKLLMPIQPVLQLVLNMQNETASREELILLNGEIMKERNFLSNCPERHESFQLILFLLCKLYIAYTFGFYDIAEDMFERVVAVSNFIMEFSFLNFPFKLYTAMVQYEQYRRLGQRKYLKNARKSLKRFAKEHSIGNPNAYPYFKLLELEDICTLSKDQVKIALACDSAVKAQIGNGFTHLEALAHERASHFLSSFNRQSAEKHYNSAMHIYKVKWGAMAKYKMMQEKSYKVKRQGNDFEIQEVNDVEIKVSHEVRDIHLSGASTIFT